MEPTTNEKETTRGRVLAVAGWLVEGRLRPECVAAARAEWQVSRRTAQVYVARAATRIAQATTFEDPLFALKLSQVQRDRIFQELQALLRDGPLQDIPQWKMKLQTLQATLRTLDSRDRTAAKLVQIQRGEDRKPAKTLRPEPPPAPRPPSPDASLRASGIQGGIPAPAPKTLRPDPVPALSAQELDRAAAAILRVPKQATESLAIVPNQRKEKPGNDIQRSPDLALGGAGCAFRPERVADRGERRP